MTHDGVFQASWLPPLPCYSWAGLLVWLLLAVGVVAFFVSLFKERRTKR